jgi:hypothetical protein
MSNNQLLLIALVHVHVCVCSLCVHVYVMCAHTCVCMVRMCEVRTITGIIALLYGVHMLYCRLMLMYSLPWFLRALSLSLWLEYNIVREALFGVRSGEETHSLQVSTVLVRSHTHAVAPDSSEMCTPHDSARREPLSHDYWLGGRLGISWFR